MRNAPCNSANHRAEVGPIFQIGFELIEAQYNIIELTVTSRREKPSDDSPVGNDLCHEAA